MPVLDGEQPVEETSEPREWAGTKQITWNATQEQELTHFLTTGIELVGDFGVTSFISISFRTGVGFAIAFVPTYDEDDRQVWSGVNWRVLPGIVFRFNQLGLFIEMGYAAHWFQHSETDYSSGQGITTKIGYTYHGMQIGAGLKFYL